MKRTHILTTQVMGSVLSWAVSISLGRRRNCWIAWLDYVDPQGPGCLIEALASVPEIAETFEARGIDLDAFCVALEASGQSKLEALGGELREHLAEAGRY